MYYFLLERYWSFERAKTCNVKTNETKKISAAITFIVFSYCFFTSMAYGTIAYKQYILVITKGWVAPDNRNG